MQKVQEDLKLFEKGKSTEQKYFAQDNQLLYCCSFILDP